MGWPSFFLSGGVAASGKEAAVGRFDFGILLCSYGQRSPNFGQLAVDGRRSGSPPADQVLKATGRDSAPAGLQASELRVECFDLDVNSRNRGLNR